MKMNCFLPLPTVVPWPNSRVPQAAPAESTASDFVAPIALCPAPRATRGPIPSTQMSERSTQAVVRYLRARVRDSRLDLALADLVRENFRLTVVAVPVGANGILT